MSLVFILNCTVAVCNLFQKIERPGEEIKVPSGYTEVYDKDTGLISYLDKSKRHWYTSQDQEGNLYFYTQPLDGGRTLSEWSLPDDVREIKSNIICLQI